MIVKVRLNKRLASQIREVAAATRLSKKEAIPTIVEGLLGMQWDSLDHLRLFLLDTACERDRRKT